MQKIELNNLIVKIPCPATKSTVTTKNKARSWKYGYDEQYDMVIISKDGMIGDVVEINSLKIALPKQPEKIYARSAKKSEQYWEPFELPKPLARIKSIIQWNEQPKSFKLKWVDYIEEEFDRRDNGFWFMNNGVPTYTPGSHYMYLQWTKIDVGHPDFREANRIFFIYWSAVVADKRCFGIDYLKIRRSGASHMAGSEAVNIGTLARDSRIGILSKTGPDAKALFTDKIVPMSLDYPFFFKPIQAGMDRPKTELAYRIPATKITKNNMYDFTEERDEIEGLNTTINWKNTEDNSYDGEKLIFLIHDESAKWLKPNNIEANYRVTKTCLRLGRKIIGKVMMVSTCNALNKGGQGFMNIYNDSNPAERNKNGQTKSGMYALFIPMEWNTEGFIDLYGMPVMDTPKTPVMGVDGELITQGAIEWWENEEESLKSKPDDLNEFYRQFPRTEDHAFRDESENSLFSLTKIYDQVDSNSGILKGRVLTRGRFHWKDGVLDSEVVWVPDPLGRFLVSWIPKPGLRNRFYKKNSLWFPENDHIGAFGCDPYDISGTVGGRGSKGALSGLTKFHMDDAPMNHFFLEYIARPATAEIFFEDILMACAFYGMPILAENNKPRLLYHFKNRGYRRFSINRPDKPFNKLSPTEKELGGVPNSSLDMKISHATAIETYIEKYVGYDREGIYRDPAEIGDMYFTKTLRDWAAFDINNRTKHDASISSGLAIMACRGATYGEVKKPSKIIFNFAKYKNTGRSSELIVDEK